MKVQMTYSEMTHHIDQQLPLLKQFGFEEVVAVVRGGLTAAHYIAKELRLPVGVYFPSKNMEGPRLILSKKETRRILFVEDLVAEGRTFRELEQFMAFDYTFRNQTHWKFFTVLMDANAPQLDVMYGVKTSDWVVFPYEKYDKMSEGDRGLFRHGSDSYGG